MIFEKNVKIPLNLMNDIIDVLECLNVPENEPDFIRMYENVLHSLFKKKESLELRDLYAKMINAKYDDARLFARLEYLKRKREINESF